MSTRAFLPGLGGAAGELKPRLRADLLAGLITAAVVIPKAMAYATIAGLAGAGRALHRARADGDLRGARHVPRRSA